jgi:hypothetical protein
VPRDFPHEVKVQGLYQVPYLGGATVGVSYLYLSGEPWGRRATFTGLRQGNQTVRIEERGTRRIDATNTLDLHIDKSFPWRRTTTSIYVDAFNVTNRGVATGVTDTSGGSFGVPSGWSAPRTIRLGARLQF